MAEMGGGQGRSRIGRALAACALLAVCGYTLRELMEDHTREPLRDDGDADDGRELVVLVHGLGRTRLSMALLAETLARRGYRVLNWGYSSTRPSVPEIGAALAERVAEETRDAPRVHFVGHSLGNILVRWMLAHRPPERAGRVVMLTPPNQGSRVADRYAPWLGWFLRPLAELSTDPASTVRTLPPLRHLEIGVIAGEYDRKVSVDEAHLPGATAMAVVPAMHTFVMNRPDVQRLVLSFLARGTFDVPRRAAHG